MLCLKFEEFHQWISLPTVAEDPGGGDQCPGVLSAGHLILCSCNYLAETDTKYILLQMYTLPNVLSIINIDIIIVFHFKMR